MCSICSLGRWFSWQGVQTPGGATVPQCLSPPGPIRWSIWIGWTWQWLVETDRQPNYLPHPGSSPELAPMLNAGLSSERLPRGVGRVRNRMSTGPIPMTLTIMNGRNMELTMSPMRKITWLFLPQSSPLPQHASVSRDAIQ